jgi:NAD(P)-dependent dehydrogenase (short-subunit alcohol dehydrogenase family)
MKIDLTGLTALITGGSRGLGEAIAKALSEAGAHIALVARDTRRLCNPGKRGCRPGWAHHSAVRSPPDSDQQCWNEYSEESRGLFA